MIIDNLTIKGTPTFTHLSETGEVLNKFTVSNLVTNDGRNMMAYRLISNGTSVLSSMAIGTSNYPVSVSNSGLGGEIARVFFTTYSVTNNTLNVKATFGPGVGTGTISEAGVFNSNSGAFMFSRVVFAPFVKAAGDTVIVDWIYEIL